MLSSFLSLSDSVAAERIATRSSPLAASQQSFKRVLTEPLTGLTVPAAKMLAPITASSDSAKQANFANPDILHLLQRTSYGYTEEELIVAEQIGFDAWLDRQLDPDALDDSGLEEVLLDAFPTLSWSYAQIFEYEREQRENGGREGLSPALELIVATLYRQWFSQRQLYEVMVEFWTNHFNTFLFDGVVQYLKPVDDRDHIRPHALGKFRDLLFANARSPAMLIYLDNYSNTVAGPNENYARELLELHTLGVDGGYTEFDVKEVARAFTGWTLDQAEPDLFVFTPFLHDDGAKRVLGVDLPAGQGKGDGDQVLEMLAVHPATAHFIASKLCQRFIADVPPEAAVAAVAETFLQTDGDIPAVLRTLFGQPEFLTASGSKLKRPLELVGSLMRRLSPESDGAFLSNIVEQLLDLGQVPFFASPPTGYDDTEPDWLGTSALLTRWNFGIELAFENAPPTAGKPGSRGRSVFGQRRRDGLGAFVPVSTLIGPARTPVAIVDALIERVLHQTIDEDDRQALIDQAGATSTDLRGYERDQAARRVLAALLSSTYFQRR